MLNILAAVLLFGFIVLCARIRTFFCWRNADGIGVVDFLWAWARKHFGSVEKGETRYSIKALPNLAVPA